MRKINCFLLMAFLLTAFTGFSQSSRLSRSMQDAGKLEVNETYASSVEKTPCKSHGNVNISSDKAVWDVEFSFNSYAAATPGVETDGTNFYTTTWNDAKFYRFDMTGAFVDSFQIAGVTDLRDMAFDGTYFYGSDASMNLYKMDLANETLVSTISATCTGVTGIRHIAYDPTLDSGNGGFWVGNWTELGAIDMSGAELVASTVTLESCYGSAYDDWTDPANPCLWLFQQPGSTSDAIFYQFDINTYAMTGTTHDCADTPGFEVGSLAGGACTLELNGKAILVGSIQQDPNLVVGYELAVLADDAAPDAVTDLTAVPDAAGALTAEVSWTNPTLDFSGSALSELTLIELFVDDSDVAAYSDASPVIGGDDAYTATVAAAGFHTFTVVGTNTAGEGIANSVNVYVGEDVPAASTSVVLTATDMDASLSWVAPTEGLNGGYFSGTGVTYDVVRYPGAVVVSEDQAATTFTETLSVAGNYSYVVTASNAIGVGASATSNSLIFGDFLLYEDFESGASTWTQEGDATWTFQSGGYDGNPAAAYEGDNNAYHGHSTTGNTTKLISPEVLVSSNDYYLLKFWMAQVNWAGDQDQLKVYFKSGVSGEWVELASYEDEVVDWTEETLVFYSAEAPYIAFEGIDGYGYGNVVDFVTVVESEVTCLAPISLSATATQTTAQLSWIDDSGDTWNIEWGEAGFTLGEGTLIEGTTDNPYTLESLVAGTNYDFYVQTDCGAETSDWVGPLTFSTLCEIFDSYPYSEGFESTVAPDCWMNFDEDGDGYVWEQIDYTVHEGSYAAMSASYDNDTYSALSPDNYLVSPQFDINVANLELGFYVAAVDGEYPSETFSVLVSTTGTAIADFVDEIHSETLTADDTIFKQVVLPLNDYQGEQIYIAFRHFNSNDNYQMVIDNVEIDVAVGAASLESNNIAIYPNPANNVVTVENAENAQVTIVNMVGQVVASQVANSNRESINISDLSNGTYVIRIENGNEVSTQKLNVIR